MTLFYALVLGLVAHCYGLTNYCNTQGCSNLEPTCVSLFKKYTDVKSNSWYWLKTPEYGANAYQSRCILKNGIVYQLLQQTNWLYNGDTQALNTATYAATYNNFAGTAGQDKAYRLPVKIWGVLSQTYDMQKYLYRLDAQATDGKFAKSSSCGTNEYTGDITISATTKNTRAYNLKADQGSASLLFNFNKATAVNGFPRGTTKTRCGYAPYWYTACCSLCPSYKLGYWRDQPHPMVYSGIASLKDANGVTMYGMCKKNGKTVQRAYNKGKYLGLARTQLWIGSDGRCKPHPDVQGGQWTCQKNAIGQASTCSFVCGTGWTLQGTDSASCEGGKWKIPSGKVYPPLCIPTNTYCNSPRLPCILLRDCEHIKHHYRNAVSGLYWFKDPQTGKPYQAWCTFDKNGVSYMAVQVTQWEWEKDTKSLDSKTGANFYNNFAGEVHRAHRIPGRVMNWLGNSHRHFRFVFYMRMSDGTRCTTPLVYSSEAQFSVDTTRMYVKNIKAHKNGAIKLLNYASGTPPAVAFPGGTNKKLSCYSAERGGVPWFYTHCCWVCPSYENSKSYWKPFHPMIWTGTDKYKDDNGNTPAAVCEKNGKKIMRTINKGYYGVDRMEFYLGSKDRCLQPAVVNEGKWGCDAIVDSGKTCPLTCNSGYALSNVNVPKCLAGRWENQPFPTCLPAGAYCNNPQLPNCDILKTCVQIWDLISKNPQGAQAQGSGVYWIKGSDGKNYQTYCLFTKKKGIDVAYTMLQRSTWTYTGDTSTLATDAPTFWNAAAGDVNKAYRLPGKIWNGITASGRGFLFSVTLRATDGSACQPLFYTGHAEVSVTASSYAATRISNEQSTNANQIYNPDFFGGGASGTAQSNTFFGSCTAATKSAVPFWQSSSCTSAINFAYQGSNWPAPEPQVRVDQFKGVQDMNGVNPSAACSGKTISTDASGAYYGVATLEFMMGGADQCAPITPLTLNGNQVGSFPTCSTPVKSGTKCSLVCTNGYAAQGVPATCVGGQWWSPTPQTCKKEQPAKFDAYCKCQSQFADGMTRYGPECKHAGGTGLLRSFQGKDMAIPHDFDFEFGSSNWDRNGNKLWTMDNKWKCDLTPQP